MTRATALSIACLLTVLVNGQYLTVTFDMGGEEGCGINSSSSALTFTTSSIPDIDVCFDIEELFGGNQSTGEKVGSQFANSSMYDEFDWTTYNAEPFDSTRNYSQVTYLQRNSSDPEEGEAGARMFQVFNAPRCHATGPTNTTLYPYYSWTCQSGRNGSCLTVPFSVASFKIVDGAGVTAWGKKCWDGEQMGGYGLGLDSAAAAKGGMAVSAMTIALVTLALVW